MEGNGGEDGGEVIRRAGDEDDVVADFCERGIALGAHGDDRAFASFDFFDVADVFIEDGVLGSDEERRRFFGDEGNDTVFEFRAGISGSRDVTDFLEFEGAFESDRIIGLPAEEHEIFCLRIFPGDFFDMGVEFERLGDEVGEFFHLRDDGPSLGMAEVPDATEEESEQCENGELGGEGFGGGDTDFGTGVHVGSAVAFTGNRAGHVVADSERAVAFSLAFPQGGEGVGGFSALADDKDERVAVHRQVAVAEFAGELTFDGDVGERLDDVFPGERGVECGATADEHDPINGAEFGIRHFEATELCGGFLGGEPSAHGIAHRVRLFENFLEHEVREAAFVHGLGAEFDFADLEFGSRPGDGGNFELIRLEGDDFVVV